jgi:hypothetical protein
MDTGSQRIACAMNKTAFRRAPTTPAARTTGPRLLGAAAVAAVLLVLMVTVSRRPHDGRHVDDEQRAPPTAQPLQRPRVVQTQRPARTPVPEAEHEVETPAPAPTPEPVPPTNPRTGKRYADPKWNHGGGGGGGGGARADVFRPHAAVTAEHDLSYKTRFPRADGGADGNVSASGDVHLFVIWHGAMGQHERILADVARHFVVLAVSYFDWPAADDGGAAFETNLWRLYSGKGGWKRTMMPLKVRQCGRGPFISVVVLDPFPDYQDEATAHGVDHVNHNMNTAKKRYRGWAGGGFKVHGTFNAAEAAHDVALLWHRDAADFAAAYRQSDGLAVRGVTQRFVQWLRAAKAEGALHADNDAGGDPPTNEITPAPLTKPVYRPEEDESEVVREVTPAPPARAHDRWAVKYRFPTPLEVLGDAAARRARLQALWLLVPYRTTAFTLGYAGWARCEDLVLAARTLGVSFTAGDKALPLGGGACRQWPTTVVVRAPWGAMANIGSLLGGTALHVDPKAVKDADPPSAVDVTVGGATVHFQLRPLRRR